MFICYTTLIQILLLSLLIHRLYFHSAALYKSSGSRSHSWANLVPIWGKTAAFKKRRGRPPSFSDSMSKSRAKGRPVDTAFKHNLFEPFSNASHRALIQSLASTAICFSLQSSISSKSSYLSRKLCGSPSMNPSKSYSNEAIAGAAIG